MHKFFRILTKKQNKLAKNRFLEDLGEDIAHELTTPFISVKAGLSGIKDCLDKLIETYDIAASKQLDIPEILPQELQSLKEVLTNCEKEIYYASHYVNLLAANLVVNTGQRKSEPLSIRECIKKAFYQFPCRTKLHKSILEIDFNFEDFKFYGDEKATIQIFTNLIIYVLYVSKRVENSFISIDTRLDETKNQVIFSCNCEGLALAEFAHIFDRFQANKSIIGLGLYFCKQIMIAIRGDIVFHSLNDKHIQFILSFPKI